MPWLDIATVAALLLGLLQLVQVGRIASATHGAITEVVDKIGNYSVMLLVPQLAVIEKDCQRAATANDVEGTLDALRRWHDAAASLKGYLPENPVVAEPMLLQITSSLTSATRAKSQIVDSTISPLDATKAARLKMTRVCADAAELAARLQMHVDPPSRPRTLPELVVVGWDWIRGKKEPGNGG